MREFLCYIELLFLIIIFFHFKDMFATKSGLGIWVGWFVFDFLVIFFVGGGASLNI